MKIKEQEDIIKRDKEIEKFIKRNFATDTEANKRVILSISFNILKISTVVSFIAIALNYSEYNGFLDAVARCILAIFPIYILLAIPIIILLLLGGLSRVPTNGPQHKKFIKDNLYGEYCIDCANYLLRENRITKDEYNRYIENNPSLKYMLEEMGYQPKKVWFEQN